MPTSPGTSPSPSPSSSDTKSPDDQLAQAKVDLKDARSRLTASERATSAAQAEIVTLKEQLAMHQRWMRAIGKLVEWTPTGNLADVTTAVQEKTIELKRLKNGATS